MSQQITGYKTDAVNINLPPEGQFALFLDPTTNQLTIKDEDNPNGVSATNQGLSANSGSATLVGGTVVVPFPGITANSLIFLTPKTQPGIPPRPVSWTIATNTGFTIISNDVGDTHTIAWLVVVKP